MSSFGVSASENRRFTPPRVRRISGFFHGILACQPLLALPLYLNVLIRFPPFWLAALLSLLPLGVRLYSEGRLSRRTPFDWPIGVFVIGLAVGTIVSPNLTVSLGALQTFAGAILIYYGLVNNSNRGHRYWLVAIGLLVLVALVMFLLYVESTNRRVLPFNSWFLNWASSWPNIAGVNVQINSAGFALAVLIPIFLSLGLFIRNRKRFFALGLTALMSAALFLIGSGSAWVAMLAGAATIVLWWRPKLLLPLIGVSCIVCLIIFMNYKPGSWFESALSFPSLLGRFALWRDTLPNLLNTPVTGMGLGSWYLEKGALGAGNNVHNSYIQLFWDTGLIGIAAATLAFVAFMKIFKYFMVFRSYGGWYGLAAGASAALFVVVVNAIYEVNYTGVIGNIHDYIYVASPAIFILSALVIISQDYLRCYEHNRCNASKG